MVFSVGKERATIYKPFDWLACCVIQKVFHNDNQQNLSCFVVGGL